MLKANPHGPVYAVATGTRIFVGVLIAILIAFAFSFYTYRGSMINAHPNDGLDGAPGSEDPSEATGKGRTPEDHPDEFGGGGGFSTHGTKCTLAPPIIRRGSDCGDFPYVRTSRKWTTAASGGD